jgi:DNA-binding transcriptional MerR regulator
MAQDFHAAFGLDGNDDRHIAVVDENGVALAAIQGLDQKLDARSRQLEEENVQLRQQNNALQRRLDRLEQRLNSTPMNSR